MKVYNTQEEIEKDIRDGELTVMGDVTFNCSFVIPANIRVMSGNITAENINARDITAWNIQAWNIEARDISAMDINAWDITANNIRGTNIIVAGSLFADKIIFHAFAVAYRAFQCKSIVGRRENARYLCLDSEVQILGEKED